MPRVDQTPKPPKKMEDEIENRKRKAETDRAVPASKKRKKTSAVSDTGDRVTHPSHAGKQPGQVMVMGQGDTGQLGLGEDIMEKKKPFPVGGALKGQRVVQVVCGGMHTAALTDDGKVFTWGCNDEGALGREVKDGEEYVPGHVHALKGVAMVQLSAGDSHTAALSTSGDVYCWGVFRDSNGPFGLVQAGSTCPTPKLVYSSPTTPAIKIASGNDHVALLTQDGGIITFGCAEQGQLGRVPEVFSSRGGRKGLQLLLQPQLVRFRRSRNVPAPKFTDMFCGSYHTFAMTEEEHVYVWGLNNFGQLGTGDTESRYQPKLVQENWLEDSHRQGNMSSSKEQRYEGLVIASGQHHTVLCNKGCVYVMGRREYGRLGLGENNSEEPATPKRLPGLEKVVDVSCGSACSFAVTETGEIFSWGMGTNLQLGSGEEEDVWSPTRVSAQKLEGGKVLCTAAGGQHTAMLVHKIK